MTKARLIALLVLSLCLLSTPPAYAQEIPAGPIGPTDPAEGSTTSEGSRFTGRILIRDAAAINAESFRGPNCDGCIWEFAYACQGSQPGEDGLCNGALTCDEGTRHVVYLTRPGEARRQVGFACIGGPGQLITETQIEAEIQRAIRELTPIGARPSRGQLADSLIHLPTYFVALGKEVETRELILAGERLVITARPRYSWDFGDGTTFETTSRGRSYEVGDNTTSPPGEADAVMHWYRTAEPVTVTLTTTWHATYVFNGGAPIDVPLEVTSPAENVDINVLEAQAILYN